MKTYFLILGVLAALTVGGISKAADPESPAVGKVLLLENDRVLEGDIEHIGDQYRVRRSIGETWVTNSHVLALCANFEDGYKFLKSRANLADADERLRLAQWCRRYGLRAQAIEEVRAAAELRPSSAEIRRLLDGLLRTDDAAAAAVPAAPRPEPAPLPTLDVSSESVAQFITKVQPILMNACLSCHGNAQGGSFRIQRCYQVGSVNHKVMQQNLSAVIGQINLAQPSASPLLIKSASTHSDTMSRAPLKDRQSPAYKALLDWAEMTAKTNPHLLQARPVEVAVSAPAPVQAPAGSSTFGEAKLPTEKPTTNSGTIPVVRPTTPTPTTLPTTPDPVASPETAPPVQKVEDAVDPGPFNRQSQPTQSPRKP